MTLLAFILSFTMMTRPANIIEELRTPEKVVTIVQTSEEMEHVVAAEEEPPAPAMHLYGNCRITFYCPNSCCCGAYASGITASGVPVQANHTVACGDLPFGTRLLIDGQEYVVEDRGVGAQQIDIFVWSHQEALDRGLYYTDVWILEE